MTHAEALHILGLVPGQPLAQVKAAYKKLKKQVNNGNQPNSEQQLDSAYDFLKKEFVEQRNGNVIEKRISNKLLLWFYLHWLKLLVLCFLIPFLWVFAKSSAIRNGLNKVYTERYLTKSNNGYRVVDQHGRRTGSGDFKTVYGGKDDSTSLGFRLNSNRYIAKRTDDEVVVIDGDGETYSVLGNKSQISYASHFSDGFALVGHGGKFSLVDENGQMLVPMAYDKIPFPFVLGKSMLKMERKVEKDSIGAKIYRADEGGYRLTKYQIQ